MKKLEQKIGRRLKMARLLLDNTQRQMADGSGVSQRDVSQLENGSKLFVPTTYIQYMYKKNIDLNSIIAPLEEVRFRDPDLGKGAKMTTEGYIPKTVHVELEDTQFGVAKAVDATKLDKIFAGLVDEPEFNLCKRKNCIHNNKEGQRCIEISYDTCIVFNKNQ